MHTDSLRDDLLAAIAVIVLLIGTASGNAYVLLGMSIAGLVLMAVFWRQQIGRGAILVALVAAVTATVIGFVMAMR
jgi:polyferredoxin